MVQGIQIIGIIFALFMLYLTRLYYKRKDFSEKEVGLWVVIWIVFLALIIFPQLADKTLEHLGIRSAMDFFTIFGFMFTVAIVFKVYDISRRNQKKLEQLVRKIAIKLK